MSFRLASRGAFLAAAALALFAACSGSSDTDPDGGPNPDPTEGGTGGDGAPACGTSGNPCPVGAACTSDDECEGKCASGVCVAPTNTDGKISPSLGETDVDCGGATAPKCGDGKGCAADGDCATAVCGATKRCVLSVSCRGAKGPGGVETCGSGETGVAGAMHESCCTSLPLPTTTTRRLDRYEITAGRLRAFVEAIAAANGGVPNLRAFAKDYAATHPGSQLASVEASAPGLLDVLPDHAGPAGAFPLPVHLGAFPLDPINAVDGCFVKDGGYGHNAYWQEPADLKPYGIGTSDANGPTGNRLYPREVLDEKAVGCVMPMLLASFCAWDGGELARTSDYHEIWGNRSVAVGGQTVKVPWTGLLPVGEFNWRNGHGASCGNLAAWPGCANPQLAFYAYPAGGNPANDDTPAMGAPGRFPKDVTATTSADGRGWLDVGGNLMEAAWPNGALGLGANPVTGVCDQTASPGGGDTPCTRENGNGVLRYTGDLPHIALIGYSFEVHQRRSEAYLASADGAESRIPAGDAKPITFQYGKVGGRCARPAP